MWIVNNPTQIIHKLWRSSLIFINRPWYPLLVSVMAGLDLFVVVIPTDGLFISSILAKPRRWIVVSVLVAVGSAVGGFVLASLTEGFLQGVMGAGETGFLGWLNPLLKQLVESPDSSVHKWTEAYGVWAIVAGGILPLPLQPFVVGPIVAGMSVNTVFIALLLGRLIKYLALGAIAAYAPNFIPYLKGIQDEIAETERLRASGQI